MVLLFTQILDQEERPKTKESDYATSACEGFSRGFLLLLNPQHLSVELQDNQRQQESRQSNVFASEGFGPCVASALVPDADNTCGPGLCSASH